MKSTNPPNTAHRAHQAFTALASVLGMDVAAAGSQSLEARKVGPLATEVTTLVLQGNDLRAERRRGNSSVVITSEATMDGAYGVFCELAPKIAAANERYVSVRNLIADADIDPQDVTACISYSYRDANNYKQAEKAYFAGPASRDSVTAFLAMLEGSDGAPSVIPGQIGLDDLQDRFSSGEWDEEADHPFHEVSSVELVDFNLMADDDAALVDARSFDEFVKTMFITLGESGGWDHNYRPEFAPERVLADSAAWPGGD